MQQDDPDYPEYRTFIDSTYFKQYKPKEKNVFEICRPVEEANTGKKVYIEMKTSAETKEVAHWLKSKSKHFGRMPLEFCEGIAQQLYAPNHNGGVFKQGQIIQKQGDPVTSVFVVFQGVVKSQRSLNELEYVPEEIDDDF